MSNSLLCDVLSVFFPFPSLFRLLKSHGFGHVTYSHSKLLSESINNLEVLQSDQLVTRLPPSQKNTITIQRGFISMLRVEFAHEIQYMKQSKSECTSKCPFFKIHILYLLACSHISTNYIKII